MIDPVKLAKDYNLWPMLPPLQLPDGQDGEDARTTWRDDARAKVKKLVSDYVIWAQSDKGVIDDPGPAPKPVEMPLRPPDPGESEDVHKKFRKITDDWYDSEFLLQSLPKTEVWAAANGLWRAKLSRDRAAKLSQRRTSLGRLRLVAFVFVSLVVGYTLWMALALTTLPQALVGGLCGLAAVIGVLAANFAFDKAENAAARAEADESTRLEREDEEKKRNERQKLLQRLGLPDDTTGA